MGQKDWKELFMKYKVYLIIIVVLIIAVIVLVKGCGNDNENSGGTETAQEAPGDGTQDTGTQDGETETAEENKLEENTHATIERLVTRFMNCLMDGDLEALEDITDYLDEDDKRNITARALAYESYSDLKLYTKNGPEEDSYIVYVICDIKILNVDTPAPYSICIYVSPKDENNDRYIRYHNVEEDQELQAYVAELEQDPEVKALLDDVNARYQEALENDKTLYDFIMNATGRGTEEESSEEAVEEAAEESGEEAAQEEEVQEEEPAEETGEATVQNRETRVTESVNVRAEASTESERLALAYQGDPITQIESYEDGWSKVEYKGLTGYVKTEFLE